MFFPSLYILQNISDLVLGYRGNLEDRLVEEFDICNVIKDYVLDENEFVEFANHMIEYFVLDTGLQMPLFKP